MERTVRYLFLLPDNIRGVPVFNKTTGEIQETSSSKLILLKDKDGSYTPISERKAMSFFNAKSHERITPNKLRVGKTYSVIEERELCSELLQAAL